MLYKWEENATQLLETHEQIFGAESRAKRGNETILARIQREVVKVFGQDKQHGNRRHVAEISQRLPTDIKFAVAESECVFVCLNHLGAARV